MKIFFRVINTITKFFDKIAQIGVLLMLFLVVGNIIGRRIWKPIFGVYDYVSYLGVIIVSFSIAYCALQKGHTQVELFMNRFSKRTQRMIDFITNLFSLGIFLLASWQCVKFGNDMRKAGELSMTSLTPFYPFIYTVSFGCALLCLVIIKDIIKSLIGDNEK
jgi:TRAP-type C4-dicarboxylate transport system permease small subunit